MSTKTKRKSDVTYWMRDEESYLVTPAVFVLDAKGRTPMFITDFACLYIYYDYFCPENTTEFEHGCLRISEATFKCHIKKLQDKYGVKFSIKTEWGTNADT